MNRDSQMIGIIMTILYKKKILSDNELTRLEELTRDMSNLTEEQIIKKVWEVLK